MNLAGPTPTAAHLAQWRAVTRRIVFMGTPDFAVPILAALHESSREGTWEIVAVATQPDREAGRGKKLTPSPVKQFAQQAGIPILQPRGFRKSPNTVEQLAEYAPDILIVAAYGIILPEAVLQLPTYGSINVHASLLPAYRGASPITAAILDGLSETGVSIMLMDAGMDTGPVLAQAHQPILPDDTTASLSARLAEQGARLLVQILPDWLSGDVPPIAQEELPGTASTCRLIRKEDGRIDWRMPAERIERMVRAYTPWPSAYSDWRGEPLKIVRAAVVDGQAEAGRVVRIGADVAVGTEDGLLRLDAIQPAGKRAMEARSFVNGAPDFVGAQLGEERRPSA